MWEGVGVCAWEDVCMCVCADTDMDPFALATGDILEVRAGVCACVCAGGCGCVWEGAGGCGCLCVGGCGQEQGKLEREGLRRVTKHLTPSLVTPPLVTPPLLTPLVVTPPPSLLVADHGRVDQPELPGRGRVRGGGRGVPARLGEHRAPRQPQLLRHLHRHPRHLHQRRRRGTRRLLRHHLYW